MSRVRLILAPVLAALLVPATAAAVDVTPGSYAAAVSGAQPDDVLTLAAGEYPDAATLPASATGVTIDGGAGARVTGDLTVQAPGTTLRQLTLAPTRAGLTIQAGAGATLDHVVATRTAGDAALVTSAGTLVVADSTLLSTTGAVLALAAPATTVVRSTLASTAAAGDAIELSNNTPDARALTVDSSILLAGTASGAATRITTTGAGMPTGTVSAALRHVTITAGANGVVANAAGALAGGDIAATIAGSIVHPPSTQATNGAAANSAAVTPTDSDTGQSTDAQQFAPDLRLRADAPAIGAGGPLADGESTTDVDGQPRPATGTDQGADQFVDRAPATGLTLSSGAVDEGATVTAVLTPSDPDLGDAISTHAFDWGDGTSVVTRAPTATHVYPRAGVYTVRGSVADARDAPSAVVGARVTVRDRTAPAIRVTAPKRGASLHKRKRLVVKGTVTDPAGVERVELALTRKAGKRCFQYRKRFRKARCAKVVYRRATLRGRSFSLRTRKGVRLAKGSYTLRVRAVDRVGNRTAKPSRKARTLVRFRVR